MGCRVERGDWLVGDLEGCDWTGRVAGSGAVVAALLVAIFSASVQVISVIFEGISRLEEFEEQIVSISSSPASQTVEQRGCRLPLRAETQELQEEPLRPAQEGRPLREDLGPHRAKR